MTKEGLGINGVLVSAVNSTNLADSIRIIGTLALPVSSVMCSRKFITDVAKSSNQTLIIQRRRNFVTT